MKIVNISGVKQGRESETAEPGKALTTASKQRPECIRVENVNHVFVTPLGRSVLCTNDISFTVGDGEFVSIVGPSGCGKTTLLNMIVGLVQPSSGSVKLHGRDCLAPRRSVGYMFARDGLMPWRTARRNVEFGLELRKVGRNERRARADSLLKQVGLQGFEQAYPKELSQGMRQRLAMARTLAIEPEVILLDEPFAALDAETRAVLQTEFSKIWDDLGKTVLLVTHDLLEAVALSDRVIVLSGRPGSSTIGDGLGGAACLAIGACRRSIPDARRASAKLRLQKLEEI
jgi:NitT/TauT family transport system ATP-binding protein